MDITDTATSSSSSLSSASSNQLPLPLPFVEVNTVDGFQGKEKDIIIFSCVRSAERGNGIGFLNDEKRVNVAVTRGKYKLLIIGKAQALSTSHVWGSLMNSLKERKYIQNIS